MFWRNIVGVLLLFTLCNNGSSQEFTELWDNELSSYIKGGKVNYSQLFQNPALINKMRNEINLADLEKMNEDEQKAFLINAYNFLVISSIIEHYPTASVQEIPNFFNLPHQIGVRKTSLDDIEKVLLNTNEDPRIHLALVCGALSCPPLSKYSFKAESIHDQLDDATSFAFQSSEILRVDNDRIQVSTIFKWFRDDFGEVNSWISKNGKLSLEENTPIDYMPYDWALNSSDSQGSQITNDVGLTSQNNLRYYASNLYTKGQYEINVFNNYFTLSENEQRQNFFSSFLRYTHGWSKRVNYILELKLRAVASGPVTQIGRFSALSFNNEGRKQITEDESTFRKIGIGAIIPRVKYTPFKGVPNLSFQHGLAIPVPIDQAGGFVDWGSPSLYNDLFYDQDLGAKSSIFIQLGIYLENIGGSVIKISDGFHQFSTPITLIYQYFADSKTTFYALVNAAPQWGYNVHSQGSQTTVFPDSYSQYGGGVKYFLNRKWQIELLYTLFNPDRPGARAHTYNIGIRYYGW